MFLKNVGKKDYPGLKEADLEKITAWMDRNLKTSILYNIVYFHQPLYNAHLLIWTGIVVLTLSQTFINHSCTKWGGFSRFKKFLMAINMKFRISELVNNMMIGCNTVVKMGIITHHKKRSYLKYIDINPIECISLIFLKK